MGDTNVVDVRGFGSGISSSCRVCDSGGGIPRKGSDKSEPFSRIS